MLRKSVRCLKRTLLCGLLVIVCYTFLHYTSSGPSSSSEIMKDENIRIGQNLIDYHQPINQPVVVPVVSSSQAKRNLYNNNSDSLSNDVTFDDGDMLDEYGNPYTIIIWSNHGGKPGYVANPMECLGNISCDITYDKSLLKSAHAVVFKSDSVNQYDLPNERKSHQQFVWWASESPLHASSVHLDNYFNLTFHYRTDADVYAPYGSFNLILRELVASGETELEVLLEKKRKANKTAAWAVSNCYGKRMEFAKSLMNAGLEVDTYGRCFNGRELGGGRYSLAFYERLSEYKFYFSFENSIHCKDYFTEKFWFNGLRSGAVPVVWGPKKSDLLKVAPKKSFIHTEDFDTPQELVKYLQYLASNEYAYAEYLQWRTWIKHPEKIEEHLLMRNRDNDLRSFCKLCSIVQADGRRRKQGLQSPQRIVRSVLEAWNGAEKGECHS